MTVDTFGPSDPTLAALAPTDATGDIVHDLGRWLQAATLAQQIAEVACRGPFVPRAFQGKPEHAATAILAGAELGLSPGAALRSFHVIEGTASLSAKMQRALILRAGHEFEVVETNAQRCTVRGRRRGEREFTEITFTIEEAENAGLTSKEVWKKWPQRMCAARATTILADLKFADVTAGIPCAEVLADEPVDITATVTNVPAAPSAAAALAVTAAPPVDAPAQAAASEPEAILPDLPDPVRVSTEVPLDGPVSEATKRAIGSAFGPLIGGPGSVERRRRVVEAIARRSVEKTADLTEAEGREVVRVLTAEGARAYVAEVLAWAAEQDGRQAEAEDEQRAAAEPDGRQEP